MWAYPLTMDTAISTVLMRVTSCNSCSYSRAVIDMPAEALRVDFMIFPLPGRSIPFDIEMFTELRTIAMLSAVVALEMTALA